MPAKAAGIELRGVVKRYGSQPALRGLDLEIRDGEFFCLLGPSGCGKTTTLNLIGGFVAPTEGEIWIRGARIDRLPPHKRPVNTVFQSYALFPHMNVRENVRFGLKMDRVPRGRVDAARGGGARARRARGLRRPDVRGAERRPAAAGRRRTCAREAAGGAPARRAARRARPEAPAAAADRALADPPRRRNDLRLRHARPGGGDVDGRPNRRDERRPRRAARHAGRDLSTAGFPLRRRLHRRLELLHGDGRRGLGGARRRVACSLRRRRGRRRR